MKENELRKTYRSVIEVYNKQKPAMIVYARSKAWSKVGMDDFFMDNIVNDVLQAALTPKTILKGFCSDDGIRKFLWNVLRTRIKTQYAIMSRKAIPELTTKERLSNFALARDIINAARVA